MPSTSLGIIRHSASWSATQPKVTGSHQMAGPEEVLEYLSSRVNTMLNIVVVTIVFATLGANIIYVIDISD